MAKKSIKIDEVTELVEDTLEKKLDLIIERVILKLIPIVDKIVKDLLTPQLDIVNKRQSLLEEENEQLRTRLDQIETEARANSLVLHGLEETSIPPTSKNPMDKEATVAVMDLCNTTLGLQIREDDIAYAYRLQKKGKEKHRPVIVKFETRGIRNLIYRTRLKLRNTSIYVNEYLTPRNAQIYAKTRDLVKEGKVNSTWTTGGITYIKLSSGLGEKPNRIRDLRDLKSLFPSSDFASIVGKKA